MEEGLEWHQRELVFQLTIQRLGFRMVAINIGVVDEARKIKPEIPETGERGIPIHDEIAMELRIEPYLDAHEGTSA